MSENHSQGRYAALDWAAQRGGRISRTGCLGGTRPSGRFWRKVAQGSSNSSAQSWFLRKKQSSQVGGLGLRGTDANLATAVTLP